MDNLHLQTLLLLLSAAAVAQTSALSTNTNTNTITQTQRKPPPTPTKVDRPLLRQYGRGINDRIRDSKEGYNRFGSGDHYTSAETTPCLDMQTTASSSCNSNTDSASSNRKKSNNDFDVSSRREIREGYTSSSSAGAEAGEGGGVHGRSSGSGCCIIRLQGTDAKSVRGLMDFADNFFEGVDSDNDDTTNNANTNIAAAQRLKELGVFRIANNVHAGFDNNVNEEGKMQVLYTKLIPGQTENDDPLLLPLEVGEMVGSKSLSLAHGGMSTLFDIGSQITSAVLGMDIESTNKILDDCSRIANNDSQQHELVSENHAEIADTMSNSYQRIIRYLKPKQPSADQMEGDAEDDAAFWPHVDSTFLTLIPLPDVAGLEVWCPSSLHAESEDVAERGEWVRPIKPSGSDTTTRENGNAADGDDDDCIHVVALAGEFLQLLSDGQVPTCIHRVIAPKPPSPSAFGFASSSKKYKPRVSAPLFLRPRRGEEAVLDVESDLRDSGKMGLYFEEGLLEECDSMRVWDYMDCMSPDN